MWSAEPLLLSPQSKIAAVLVGKGAVSKKPSARGCSMAQAEFSAPYCCLVLGGTVLSCIDGEKHFFLGGCAGRWQWPCGDKFVWEMIRLTSDCLPVVQAGYPAGQTSEQPPFLEPWGCAWQQLVWSILQGICSLAKDSAC